ncbi:uncharacterized protein [Panulirus ornatus]|uniref:uncharacterized protein n=1 Tax=Panulirus ornatus TaxID=150431 RepID=UPI003A8A2B89
MTRQLRSGAAIGEVLGSLWDHGIKVSVFSLPSAPTNPSSAHDAVDEDPIRRHNGVSTQLTGDKGEDHVSEADSVTVGIAGEVGFRSTMATRAEKSLKAALDTADGKVAVILVGGVDWVTHLAIHINQKMLLGPSKTLLLHSTSGSIPEELLAPHLRLVAKVIVLEEHRPKTWLESTRNGGVSCTGEVKQAILLEGGTYALRYLRLNLVSVVRANIETEPRLNGSFQYARLYRHTGFLRYVCQAMGSRPEAMGFKL